MGKNLQAFAPVELNAPAPEDLTITLTSGDPARLILAATPNVQGAASLTITVRAGFRASQDIWLQALADSGEVEYTASASGFATATGKVTLAPSGIAIFGPLETPQFNTTPNSQFTKLVVRPARLDASLNFVEWQWVRGGLIVPVTVTSSDPKVGHPVDAQVNIEPASDSSILPFQALTEGLTTLTATAPGFSKPASSGQVVAIVKTPGLGITDDQFVGENLQIAGVLTLGEPAPPGGVSVTLTSAEPDKLLLSDLKDMTGKASVDIHIPEGGINALYGLQGLARSGSVTHSASAPGYRTRTATINLAPSGVVLMLSSVGPPDEAELLRPDTAGPVKEHVYTASVSQKDPTMLQAFTVFLHAETHRGADITLQPLRPGVSVALQLHNSNPSVGTVESPAIIPDGMGSILIPFTPRSPGQTRISLVTPDGFTTPTNAQVAVMIVNE